MTEAQMKRLEAGAVLIDGKYPHYTALIKVVEVTDDGLEIFPYNADSKYLYDNNQVLPWSYAAFLSEVKEDRLGEAGYLLEPSSMKRRR